jgi:hypothetical protein
MVQCRAFGSDGGGEAEDVHVHQEEQQGGPHVGLRGGVKAAHTRFPSAIHRAAAKVGLPNPN